MGTTTTNDVRSAQRQIAGAIEEGGMSRTDIAAKLGVQLSTITHALDPKRSPKPETLNAIAECVGLEVRVVVLPLPPEAPND